MRAQYAALALMFCFLLVSYTVPRSSSDRSAGPIGPIPLIVGDAAYVFFSPPLSNVLVSSTSSDGGPYRQLTSMNESIETVPVPIGIQGSYVQFIPQSAGQFYLVLNVTSQHPFTMLLGVLTRDASNFAPYRIFSVERAYFVEIVTMRGLDAANWSISFIFSVEEIERSFWFSIPIPSSVGLLFLGAALGGLAYPNAYLITDIYFRSKKEEISKKRKIGVGLSIIVSLLLIYWIFLRVT